MMKKLSELSLNISEKEYRDLPHYSQSIIGRYEALGFEGIPKLFDKIESPSLLFGSLLDCLMTSPEEFDRLYVVEELPKLSESLEPIVRSLFSIYGNAYTKSLAMIPEKYIHSVCDEHNYYANPKYHKYRIKKVLEEGEPLYQALLRVGDKTLIDSELYNEAVQCKDAILNSYCARFFIDDPFNNDIELFSQLKFEAEYKDLKIKCMLDKVVVDHKNKIIIPVDLKTSYKPAYNFPKSYIKWKYYHQSQMYTYILKQVIKNDEYFKDFKVSKFFFVVISRSDKTPLLWVDIRNKTIGPLIIDNKIHSPSWTDILIELDKYLKEEPKVPYGYKLTAANDIYSFINGKVLE